MIRFSKYLNIYFLISGLVLIPGMFYLLVYGLRQSVDFTGGTVVEIRAQEASMSAQVKSTILKSGLPIASMQETSQLTYQIRLRDASESAVSLLHQSLLNGATASGTITRSETVGPVLGKELLQKTLIAALFAMIVILSYVAYAFKNIKFGVSAVIALVHDLLVVLGTFAILGRFFRVEVDTLFVTAFLTTMSFSVHDTIVVFDRIRELLRKGSRLPFEELCDVAMNETMNRSLTNSLTIVFMLLALVLMGGETIKWFVVALLVGTISGTYSSPFVATPVLILWDRWEKKRNA